MCRCHGCNKDTSVSFVQLVKTDSHKGETRYCLDTTDTTMGNFVKKGLSMTVNLTKKKEECSKVLCGLLITNNSHLGCVTSLSPVWVQWVSKRELHSRITPLLRTTLSQGQGQQSYTDSPRVRDKPRGCRQSTTIAHKAIKFTTWSTIRGSNTSCFHY